MTTAKEFHSYLKSIKAKQNSQLKQLENKAENDYDSAKTLYEYFKVRCIPTFNP
jgi:hypothetical protein